jgi:hypothetical protein
MLLIECSPPFQWKPKYHRFGDFRRIMWGWFAVSIFSGGGINELLEGIGKAGASLYRDGDLKLEDDHAPNP